MNKNELEKLLIDEFKLSNETLDNLNKYYELIIKYNKVMNLTALTSIEDIYIKHFYDALLITKTNLIQDNNSLLDIGTGLGIPGIVLKIYNPTLKVTLLDATSKKCKFLETVINELKLKDIYVVCDRAENYALNNKESFDIVTSRAVARLNILDELCIPFVKINGYFIAYKSLDTANELQEAINGIKELGGIVQNTTILNLPNNDTRSFVEIKKIKKTPLKYPREYAKIKKDPII